MTKRQHAKALQRETRLLLAHAAAAGLRELDGVKVIHVSKTGVTLSTRIGSGEVRVFMLTLTKAQGAA